MDMQLGSTEAVKHAVHAGLGISLVMESAVKHEQASGWLHAIPIEEDVYKDLYLVLTLPLFRVALSPTITRPFCAVPRTSVARTASD